MRKIMLSVIFMLGVMLTTSGIVVAEEIEVVDGCGDCDVLILNTAYDYYSTAQGDILIDWTATGDDCGSEWDVYYGFWENKQCVLEDWLGQVHLDTEYQWDISGFSDEAVCVKVEGECCDDAIEGPLYIDNRDPIADANGETCYCDGYWWTPDCDDECDDSCCEINCVEGLYTCFEGDFITLDGGDSYDPGQFPSGIDTWDWYVDGVFVGEGETLEYECLDGPANLDVELIVTDNVGNEGSDSAEIEEINVAPVCDGIDGPSEVPLIDGEADATFTGYAHDASDKVDELVPLIFNWDFGDSSSDSGNPSVTHTYTTPGYYEVVLSVEDKDGGVSEDCMHMIEVIEPIPLDDQEVAAYYPLMVDFGEDAGDNWRSFETGLTGMSWHGCGVYIGPDNLRSRSFDDGECRVRWDNDSPPPWGLSENPTNDEQGNHFVVIRVTNGWETKYFSFNVMVYSWIIDLDEGWNLVSIPYVPEDSSINDEGVGIVQIKDELASIWSYEYDASGDVSSWKCRKTTSGGSWSSAFCADTDTKLDTIVPGRGYWLNMDESAQIKGFGTQVGQNGVPGMPPEIGVPGNRWSLIGRYGILGHDGPFEGETCWDAGGISKHTALESLTMGRDNELHVFDIDDDAHMVDVDKLFNNEGYWLWIEDENFGDHDDYGYAPLDEYYREDLSCGGCHIC